MTDEQKKLMHSAEMAEHANGAAQYFDALLGGRFVTKEQTRDMVDFLFARTKMNIESCPFASQEEKGCRDTSQGIVVEYTKATYGAIVAISQLGGSKGVAQSETTTEEAKRKIENKNRNEL